LVAEQRGSRDDVTLTEQFTDAYLQLSPRVLGYLRSHGVDDPEAVTQDVFMTLHSRLATLSGGAEGIRTLTFSIAHARLVDHYRAASRRPVVVPFDPVADPRTVPSAEDVHGSRFGERGVMTVLSELGDDQREAVSLRVVAGLSLEETAEVMGRSAGAVKQLQRRALLALRELLEEGEADA